MGAIKWYKRDPQAALNGMMVLSLEERGAYNTILDLIYTHDNNLIDDDRYISGWLRCDMRVWKRLKGRLIELGKIELKGGLVTNFRATSEVDEALGRVASVSEINRIKGIKSGIARNKNNSLLEPRGEPKSNTPTTTPTITTREEERVSSSAKDEWAALEQKLREAAGWERESHPNLSVVGPIVEMIATGSSLELDVLPVVKATAPRANGRTSWNYFIPGIRDATKTRLGIRAAALSPADEAQWTERLDFARKNRKWGPTWGPAPGQSGCGVPASLLKSSDGKDWTEWRATA